MYALEKKMADEQVLTASAQLQVLQLVKSANDYNRYCQGQKTREANEKLKEFLNPEKSEILSAGKWLIKTLSQKGDERKKSLLEKELVHKEDYNETVMGMRGSIEEIEKSSSDNTENSKKTIGDLERRIDDLRKQLSKIQDYVVENYDSATWGKILDTF